ncbi:hypothetical protein Tco_0513837 [Tanacetum coccineum]
MQSYQVLCVEESKKMQKNVLKHQFENFSTASNESLDKAYDRFQKLISQLEVHGAPISKEDINQKFLRSLPPSWNQIALIMRNKPDIDEIDIDDLYNNLRVYEDEMKRSSSSTSTSQNLAFLSSENTSSTNEVSTASGDFGVSTAGGISRIDEDDLVRISILDDRWLCICQFWKESGKDLMVQSARSNAPTYENNNLHHRKLLIAENKITQLNLELEKVVKEIDELKLKIEKWEESSKNLNELLNSLDEYTIRKKIIKLKTTDLNTKPSEIVGKTNEANTQKPKTIYESVNRDKVIIEDWNSDDEDDVSEV